MTFCFYCDTIPKFEVPKTAQFQTGKMTIVDGEHTPLTEEMEQVLDYVFNSTIDMDTLDLVEKSHVKDGPWSQVFDANDPKHEQIITKSSIYDYYKSRNVFV